MQLNPSEISELIKSRIQNLGGTVEARTQGTVISVTDGICRVHGLADAMQGEMLEFPNNTFGLALNLERDSVGAVVLGDYEHITDHLDNNGCYENQLHSGSVASGAGCGAVARCGSSPPHRPVTCESSADCASDRSGLQVR